MSRPCPGHSAAPGAGHVPTGPELPKGAGAGAGAVPAAAAGAEVAGDARSGARCVLHLANEMYSLFNKFHVRKLFSADKV